MPDIIETLLLRNLQEIFGEGDPTRRRAAITELYTEDCTVLLPTGRYVGHAALDRVAGELRASHPSFVYTPHRPPRAVQRGCSGLAAEGPLWQFYICPHLRSAQTLLVLLNGLDISAENSFHRR